MRDDLDDWSLYESMKRSRLFEEAVAKLWDDGRISGEMHLGTGEEAIVAGVVAHLRDGDAMALDHRATSALLMRGVDPVSLMKEMLGRSDGLCSGNGGHMHLFSRPHLAASSGIVGASGPSAVGFGLAAQQLRPGSVAVAFFGEGAMNQGMLMESLNLAAVWELPVVFVCKDDGWAITTRPERSTRGRMRERVSGLGVHYEHVNGLDVGEVSHAGQAAVERARQGQGPSFVHADCVHLEGHFMGLLLLRIVRDPVRLMPGIGWGVTKSLLSPKGAAMGDRAAGLADVMSPIVSTARDPRRKASNDPVERARLRLSRDQDRLHALDTRLNAEIAEVVAAATTGATA